MYSLISKRMRADSSSNRLSARALASSVFRLLSDLGNIKEPIGRLLLRIPDWFRRMARLIAEIASSCPITFMQFCFQIEVFLRIRLRSASHRNPRQTTKSSQDIVFFHFQFIELWLLLLLKAACETFFKVCCHQGLIHWRQIRLLVILRPSVLHCRTGLIQRSMAESGRCLLVR